MTRLTHPGLVIRSGAVNSKKIEGEKNMADWPPVIDADGHVLERQSDIRKYLEPPWNRRNTGLWPSDQPFDTDLFATLGYPGYERGLSPAQQVETWLKIMDEYNIEEAELFPN
jgi:hypothetical protein